MVSGSPEQLPVAVIGAGPVGLSAAAQLATRGLDFVVLEAGDQVAASVRAQLAARARQRGSVLVPFTTLAWEGADISLTPENSVWHGLGQGSGRLRSRELTVCARGRGSAERPRRSTFWLPGPPVPAPEPPQRVRLTVVR